MDTNLTSERSASRNWKGEETSQSVLDLKLTILQQKNGQRQTKVRKGELEFIKRVMAHACSTGTSCLKRSIKHFARAWEACAPTGMAEASCLHQQSNGGLPMQVGPVRGVEKRREGEGGVEQGEGG